MPTLKQQLSAAVSGGAGPKCRYCLFRPHHEATRRNKILRQTQLLLLAA